MKNILVTGAGALLGQGILRCLNNSTSQYNIITADPSSKATGHSLGHKSYLIPFISDSSYKEKLESIIKKENIDAVLVGTDVELPFFAKFKGYFKNKFNCLVVISDSNVINIANDKWLTAEFLRKNNLPFPLSAMTSDLQGINTILENNIFPLIAKPVDGARSKGIKILKNKEDLSSITSYDNNLVVQELLSDHEGEFTTGCIVVNKKCVALVSMTRELRDGNTWTAKRVNNSPYDKVIKKVAESLGAEGPVNFQYRIRNGEPVIFEINCRFSGTTPLRYMFGFNEVDALLQYYLNNQKIKMPTLKTGIILRTFSDIFVQEETIKSFEDQGVTDNYLAHYFPFKN